MQKVFAEMARACQAIPPFGQVFSILMVTERFVSIQR